MMLLKNKVIVISGIGPGLGVKLAVSAAQSGASGVVLASRTQEKLDEAEAQIQQLSVDCKVLKIVTDICVQSQCQQLVDTTIAQLGRIDGLVNSAYYHGYFDAAENADLTEWRKVMETNLFGTMNMTQAVIPSMKQQGSGSIIMISTQAARKPVVIDLGSEAGYATSKGALGTTVKYLAQELGVHGIRVNTMLMGWMWGAPVKAYVAYTADRDGVTEEEVIEKIASNIALRRIPTDDECAQAVMLLLSDNAKVITGASIDVNGGEYMPI